MCVVVVVLVVVESLREVAKHVIGSWVKVCTGEGTAYVLLV